MVNSKRPALASHANNLDAYQGDVYLRYAKLSTKQEKRKDVGNVPKARHLTDEQLLKALEARNISASLRQQVANELTGHAAPSLPPKMSAAAAAAFRAHAAANPWAADGTLGASEFIETTFKKWLKKGVPLKLIRSAQGNLAHAYLTEIGRHPERRLTGVYIEPHSLPAGTPPPPLPISKRRVAELTPEQRESRKILERTNKARTRAKNKSSLPRASALG